VIESSGRSAKLGSERKARATELESPAPSAKPDVQAKVERASSETKRRVATEDARATAQAAQTTDGAPARPRDAIEDLIGTRD
jgi:hypothetical protein